ncbi:MAG: hypothetical protein GC151_15565 [Betaproteobacteria bacterium]|nr:hypothetical protein [Betaproteobacteria bacterium]
MLAFAVLLQGCADVSTRLVNAPRPGPTAESLLRDGLRAYDDGRYEEARHRLRDALDGGLTDPHDRTSAYKHLAFIYCANGSTALCRDAFGRALEIDPTFTLSPSEAGHPIWGPVFRSLKNRSDR